MVKRIEQLEISNFKSIRHLKIPCRRINVFIGPPNSGKSNILESLGILSLVFEENYLFNRFIRFMNMTDLFYDQEIGQAVKIVAKPVLSYSLRHQSGMFHLKGLINGSLKITASLDITGHGQSGISDGKSSQCPIRFYRFKALRSWPRRETEFLLPPYGENLYMMIQTNLGVKSWVSDLFENFGFKLGLKPAEERIEFVKEKNNVVYSFPYYLASDTIQRLVLYQTAMMTNKNSVLLFEEPEAHAFPFYTKQLAETIVRNSENQFFLTTHNPYFLLTLIEKTPIPDLAVFYVELKNFETRIIPLSEQALQKILDQEIEIFFNLDVLKQGLF